MFDEWYECGKPNAIKLYDYKKPTWDGIQIPPGTLQAMVSPVPTIYAARILHFPQAWLVLLGAVEVIFMVFFSRVSSLPQPWWDIPSSNLT